MRTEIQWIKEVKNNAFVFLENMAVSKKKGFYKYSYSGDLIPYMFHWGLANTVFALKIMHIIGYQEKHKIKNAIEYVRTFKKNDTYSDWYINVFSFPVQIYAYLRYKKPVSCLDIMRAQTRQSYATLIEYKKIKHIESNFLISDFNTRQKAVTFIDALDWNKPWHAGSHVSHVLFFIKNSTLPNKQEIIDDVLFFLRKIYHEKDGCWYTGNPSIEEKINGAMKIVTGLTAVDGLKEMIYAESLYHFILKQEYGDDACDLFNAIYVLRHVWEVAGYSMNDELDSFLRERIRKYKEYYYPKKGGFSFKKNKSNTFFYNAPVSRGKQEPDIHGTVMFLWGLSVILSFYPEYDTILHTISP